MTTLGVYLRERCSREGYLTFAPIVLFSSEAPQGLELAGAPRRVDARGNPRDDCNTCRKF